LDKLKREYNIDYGLGPTYDEVPKIDFYLFLEEIQG